MGCSGSKEARVSDPDDEVIAPTGKLCFQMHTGRLRNAGTETDVAFGVGPNPLCLQDTLPRTPRPGLGVCPWLSKLRL